MNNQKNKIQDVSQDEKIISKQDLNLENTKKYPIYIRTLNIFTNPLLKRFDKFYKESKKHLIIDLILIFLIILLILINIFLLTQKFPIETFELKITHQKVSGETDKQEVKNDTVPANLIFNNQLIYYTKESEQLGIGAWPPKVNATTSARIVWELSSSPRAIKNIKIQAKLPTNINYTNKIAVNKGKTLNFDKKTRLITWNLDELKLNEKANASFEIEFIPNENQVNQKIKLLENAFATGFDFLFNEQITTYSNNIYSPVVIPNDL